MNLSPIQELAAHAPSTEIIAQLSHSEKSAIIGREFQNILLDIVELDTRVRLYWAAKMSYISESQNVLSIFNQVVDRSAQFYAKMKSQELNVGE